MNLTDAKYHQFALVREMMEAPGIMAGFDLAAAGPVAAAVRERGKLFLAGEGSSRIFPAKYHLYLAGRAGVDAKILSEGGRQAAEYQLDDYVVVGASNSGRTKEIVSFMEGLADHYRNVFRVGLTSNPSTPLEATCDFTHVLACGAEQAVAATKSVVEQGLFYYSLLHLLGAAPADAAKLRDAAAGLEYALTASVPAEMLAAVENASCVYWCGRNNGVAEELTLKTNEVIRRRADYLEGTYAFHGIEDAMDRGETVVLIDPEAEYVPKFQERLGRGAGVDLVAIAHRETGVPTLVLPEAGDLNGFLQMAAGWNLLVEVGIRQGVNLDKPERARKVGLEAGK